MNQFRCVSFVGLLLALGACASLRAGKDDEDETAPDQPVLLETSPFHAPVRLQAANGVIDSGVSWGHSSPWLGDVDGDGKLDLLVGDFCTYLHIKEDLTLEQRQKLEAVRDREDKAVTQLRASMEQLRANFKDSLHGVPKTDRNTPENSAKWQKCIRR
jgi:hypothetical protein